MTHLPPPGSIFRCRRSTRLLHDNRGVSAIEFALVAMPLIVIIMAGIEFGFMIFTQSRLEGVLQQAARMATTGNDDINGSDGSKINAMVQDRLTVVNGANVDIQTSYYDRFDQVRQPEDKDSSGTKPPYCWTDVNGNQKWDLDPSRSGFGDANDIINYKVTVTYPVLFPLVTRVVTGKNQIVVTGQTTLENEPFAGGSDIQPKKCCISAAAGNPVTCTST